MDENKSSQPTSRFGPREMHNIKCSECGMDTTVPFKPAEGRPVYCKACYVKRKKQ